MTSDRPRSGNDEPGATELVPGRGKPGRGGGPGGHYWHVYAGGERAGYVFINVVDEPLLGRHASIQIFLNARARGLHIGRQAYRLACEQSGHGRVYAHMRASNVASRKAAQAAGFCVAERPGVAQLLMVWERHGAQGEQTGMDRSRASRGGTGPKA